MGQAAYQEPADHHSQRLETLFEYMPSLKPLYEVDPAMTVLIKTYVCSNISVQKWAEKVIGYLVEQNSMYFEKYKKYILEGPPTQYIIVTQEKFDKLKEGGNLSDFLNNKEE